jgi:hypothetical protein
MPRAVALRAGRTQCEQVMRPVLPLLLLLGACVAEPPPEAALPGGEGGTFVADYGGGTAPVARYVRLPDGRAVPVEAAPPGAAPAAVGADGKPVGGGGEAVAEAPAPRARGGRATSTGSAFAITANGLAVTNAHVVQGCASVVDEQGRTVRVVASDRRRDLALIDAGRGFGTVVRFRPQAAVDLGETVLVFGFPYGQALGTGNQRDQRHRHRAGRPGRRQFALPDERRGAAGQFRRAGGG